MLIGELSKKTGLSKYTIRFYEKIGLIAASDRKAGTRIYKEFNEETIERLLKIDRGKKLGFKLKEMQLLLDKWGNTSMPDHEQIKILENKFKEVEEKMHQLDVIKDYLAAKLNKLKKDIL